jgi:pimeloyl-ACP methyl ester carboxylesterase
MARVLVVPGLAVRGYVEPAVRRLTAIDLEAELLRAPGEPGVPTDLLDYGRRLGARLSHEHVDALIGLSVGAQVAAVAAAATTNVRHLLLVSPTVDPEARSPARLLGRFLGGSRLEPPRLGLEQAPDWFRAGPRRLKLVAQSALGVFIEDMLSSVRANLTVVHAEHDVITSHCYAAALAADYGGELVVVPGATHSWPYADGDSFASLVERTVA